MIMDFGLSVGQKKRFKDLPGFFFVMSIAHNFGHFRDWMINCENNKVINS